MLLLREVFNTSSDKLPTLQQWGAEVVFFQGSEQISDRKTFELWLAYIQHSYLILSHEFISDLSNYCRSRGRVVDLCCGQGWLSHWLNRYGVPCTAVDDKSWDAITKYLPEVISMDAVKFLEQEPDIASIILSWPMFDRPTAIDIWDRMVPGQDLVFIGPYKWHPTTADFFEAVSGHEIADQWGVTASFRSFDGHDCRIVIYRK